MKFNKKLKKGFTLVELIVVIAIVAILAAVSVVSYLAFINSANESADVQLVKQLNTCLQADEALHGKKDWSEDYTGLTSLLESNGFIVENLTKTKSGCDMVYQGRVDENTIINRYALLKGKDVLYSETTFAEASNFRNLWIPETFDEAKTLSKAGKGVVLGSELGELTEEFEAHGSVIVNGAKVSSIKYENSTENAQNVVIRTNGGNLKIKGENDNVKHYGIADIVEIEKIAPTSYHEFGTTGSLTIEVGHVEVEEGAYIAQATVNNSASLTTKTTGKVAYLAASETATIEGTTITTTQKQVNYVQVGETSKYTYQENDVVKTALFVKTVDELNAALNGTTDLTGVSKVVLANDLTIEHTTSSSNVIVKVDTTLDLNGYKITCNNQYNSTGSSNSFFFVQNCEFRIVDIKGNGMISYNNTYNCNVDLFIVGQTQMTKNTTLILDSGILEFNSSNSNAGTYCIDVMDNHASYTASFIMNGGSILCKDSSGGNNAEAIRLYDNGNVANANRNCYVEINNGYITGDIYFQMGLKSPVAHVGEDTLVINGGTIIAKRPIRSTQYTANTTACWGYAVITLNGGNIIATEGFGNGYLSYMNIIGTSYGDSSSNAWSNVSSWTAEKIFNITDNR